MPEPKEKSENYSNFGGINQKTSPYITSPIEFLQLQNFDFRIKGSLASFAGSTLWGFAHTTAAFNAIYGIGAYSRQSSLIIGSFNYSLIAADSYQVFDITGGTFNPFYTNLYPASQQWQFQEGTYYFGSNGGDMFTYTGASPAIQYGLPAPYLALNQYRGLGTGGLSGPLNIYFAYVRNDGLYGPAIVGYSIAAQGWSQVVFQVPTLPPLSGISFGSFGISGIQIWVELNGQQIYANSTVTPLTSVSFSVGMSFPSYNDGTGIYSALEPQPEFYFGTFLYGFNDGNGASGPPGIGGVNNPSAMAIYANQLFCGSFLLAPDDVWYSQIGNYEKHDVDGFLSVKENDGDFVSCIIPYYTELILFKTTSSHILSGADPSTFVLIEATSEYGCVGPRAACVWQQNLWFLDKKGIAIFNGAATSIISVPVENYFLRMNLNAAFSCAYMLHVKSRSEIWTAIPIDGSSYANIVIIYDYVGNCWSTRTINEPATYFARIKAPNGGYGGIVTPDKPPALPGQPDNVFEGGASGNIYYFGNSLTSDYIGSMTCMLQSRFINAGHSVEQQFRRLYLDVTIPQGSTQIFPINFYSNQGTTPVLSTTMVLSSFQNRIDFGIPARDLSVQIFYSGGQFIQINGFTIEYRFQRSV
jgi:hypothetical protein